jgi:hypothetical protein
VTAPSKGSRRPRLTSPCPTPCRPRGLTPTQLAIAPPGRKGRRNGLAPTRLAIATPGRKVHRNAKGQDKAQGQAILDEAQVRVKGQAILDEAQVKARAILDEAQVKAQAIHDEAQALARVRATLDEARTISIEARVFTRTRPSSHLEARFPAIPLSEARRRQDIPRRLEESPAPTPIPAPAMAPMVPPVRTAQEFRSVLAGKISRTVATGSPVAKGSTATSSPAIRNLTRNRTLMPSNSSN